MKPNQTPSMPLFRFIASIAGAVLVKGSTSVTVAVSPVSGHTFTFTADGPDSQYFDSPAVESKRLLQAAAVWCRERAAAFTVSENVCVNTLVGEVAGKLVASMDPMRGLAPGLVQYIRAHGQPSVFRDAAAWLPQNQTSHSEQVVRMSWTPSLVYLPGFVDNQTCDELIRLAEPLLKPSEVDNLGPTGFRTSSSAFLTREAELNRRVSVLIERVHNMMHVPPDHGEGMQVTRYRNGERYRFHHDAFDGAPRTFTFLAYLNTPAGGDTIFPLISSGGEPLAADVQRVNADPTVFERYCEDSTIPIMRFAPKQGDAILFTPMLPWLQNDELSLHGACPVKGGEKWVLQRWARPIYDPSFRRMPKVPTAMDMVETTSLGDW